MRQANETLLHCRRS